MLSTLRPFSAFPQWRRKTTNRSSRPLFRACLFGLLATHLVQADDLVKPDRVALSTWLREDMFAGFVGHDDATFERGVKKLDRYLLDHPNDRAALAWQYSVDCYRMVQARRKSDDAAYQTALAAARELRARIFEGAPRDPGLNIVVGSTLVAILSSAAEADRGWMLRDARDLLAKVPELQADYFDRLPPHMRGELWSELAFVSDRLGDTAERDREIENMVTRLAGTPYEARGRAWQKGSLAREKEYACISCHEPGRLAPTLARLNASAQK